MQGRRSRPRQARSSGRHLLRSDQLAWEIVAQAGVDSRDLVVEIGAGTGRITAALARTGAHIVAIELDELFAAALRRRFHDNPEVEVVQGDVLKVHLPLTPFRALGNIPFGVTTSILRRLFDVQSAPPLRADLIVQYEVARKRASVCPNDLLSVGWLPWWEFHLHRRLPAGAFDPPPGVDAGVLSITKRRPSLLPPELRSEYLALVRAGFRHADLPVQRSLRGRLPERAWKRMARERGLPPGAKVRDLDVFDWTALFRLERDAGRV